MSLEERFYDTVYTGMSKSTHGALQRVVGIRCPFCDTVTEAYLWSLAGSGKKCVCGAKHTYHPPTSTRVKL